MGKGIMNILIHWILEREMKRYIPIYIKGRLVDIGCGEKPYVHLMKPYVTEHVGIDFEETQHDKSMIDLFGTAYHLPVESSSFDSAICTAVLEHLEEPGQALRECYRVLKRGGVAIYSVPFIWHLHEEPRDFYRFSKYGLKYLFEKAGFEIVDLKALSGFWITFGQMLVYYLYRFNLGIFRWLRIIDILGLLIQTFSYLLDKLDKAEQWTWMYLIVVKKVDTPAIGPGEAHGSSATQ